jgi:hypothetical protein
MFELQILFGGADFDIFVPIVAAQRSSIVNGKFARPFAPEGSEGFVLAASISSRSSTAARCTFLRLNSVDFQSRTGWMRCYTSGHEPKVVARMTCRWRRAGSRGLSKGRAGELAFGSTI